jgi:hypothetical protein|tara:strand:+ start:265 stop:555 length:291 start_codon:yes stop_codon:yes gene_type:complete
MSNKTNDYIVEAVDNIRKDREITKELLNDAIKWLSKDEARHKELGIVMAKYVETLQRSNEQLVKVVGMMAKNTKDDKLSNVEMDEIFDMISKDNNE